MTRARTTAAALVLLTAMAPQGMMSQEPISPAIPGPTGTFTKGQWVGVAGCLGSQCHGKPAPSNERNIRQDEYQVWQQDPHRQKAYKVLSSDERSGRIVRALGMATEPPQTPLCVACHAISPQPGTSARALDPDAGIGCEGCHGAAGGWIEGHASEGWTHVRSVASGMLDLRDLTVRTGRCLDCHLGTGKADVDHSLIAAGHPDLFFELDTYTDLYLTPHWNRFQDLRDRVGRTNTHGVRAWAVGQVEALRMSLLHLARRTERAPWPEFAEASCEGCHHEVGKRPLTQDAGRSIRPGGIPWGRSGWPVARHVLQTFAPESIGTLERYLETISRGVALPETPASEVASAARAAADVLASARVRVERAELPEERLIALLEALVAEPERGAEDRKSARLLACSIDALVNGLNERRIVRADVRAWSDALLDFFPDRYDRDAFLAKLRARPQKFR